MMQKVFDTPPTSSSSFVYKSEDLLVFGNKLDFTGDIAVIRTDSTPTSSWLEFTQWHMGQALQLESFSGYTRSNLTDMILTESEIETLSVIASKSVAGAFNFLTREPTESDVPYMQPMFFDFDSAGYDLNADITAAHDNRDPVLIPLVEIANELIPTTMEVELVADNGSIFLLPVDEEKLMTELSRTDPAYSLDAVQPTFTGINLNVLLPPGADIKTLCTHLSYLYQKGVAFCLTFTNDGWKHTLPTCELLNVVSPGVDLPLPIRVYGHHSMERVDV
jgi:hypothetical protein